LLLVRGPMSVPDTIAVEQCEDYYTEHIGRDADGGQFMAGRHRDTKAWFAGTTADGEEAVCQRAAEKRDEMIAGLGDVELCGVRVKLFSVEIDGHVFGMIDTSDPELGPRVTLEPNDFLFRPPWDGAYDT